MNSTEIFRKTVKRSRPNAQLKTNGFMYWIQDGEQVISQRMVSAERAWLSASRFVIDNGE